MHVLDYLCTVYTEHTTAAHKTHTHTNKQTHAAHTYHTLNTITDFTVS